METPGHRYTHKENACDEAQGHNQLRTEALGEPSLLAPRGNQLASRTGGGGGFVSMVYGTLFGQLLRHVVSPSSFRESQHEDGMYLGSEMGKVMTTKSAGRRVLSLPPQSLNRALNGGSQSIVWMQVNLTPSAPAHWPTLTSSIALFSCPEEASADP